MAKKKASKKVSKKKAGKREKPVDASKKESKLLDDIDDLSDEEVEEIVDPGAEQKTVELADASMAKKDTDKVRINLPVTLKIKRKFYHPGQHIVERHQAQTMLEMVDKKRRADLSIFTGKNYLVERLLDRSLQITNVDELDLAKISKK
jgi:hypothetical protein